MGSAVPSIVIPGQARGAQDRGGRLRYVWSETAGEDGMLKRTEGPAFVATLGRLSDVTATAISLCIPAQPTIAAGFGVPASSGGALVTAYLLGYGLGQLFWGLLADRFGRLPPLYVSLVCFVVASIVCATTGSFALLLAARGVQGIAGAAAPVIARAVARDQGGGIRSARLLSTMTVIVGLAPLLAPTIGSGLLTLFAWTAVFWFLAAFGAAATGCAALRSEERSVGKKGGS